jgi:hypothetical protein
VSGCFGSSELIGTKIPRLDPRDEAPCYDPGVSQDAVVATAENRVALASCRAKHQNVVDQFNSVRVRLGKSEKQK